MIGQGEATSFFDDLRMRSNVSAAAVEALILSLSKNEGFGSET